MKSPEYECPRCLFQTVSKTDMKRHLYKKLKLCCAIRNDIELTDEIKQYVLDNRIWKPKETMKTINQTINNYNTMNNYVSNIDLIDKLGHVLNHHNINVVPFERTVEIMYETRREQLEKDHGVHVIDEEDIFDIIDQVTKISESNLEDLNLFYDMKMNKMMMYDSGDWREFFVSKGLKKIINTIQDYFWNAYECYLIRKILKEPNFQNKARTRECLHEYYKFLASTNVDPFIKDAHNNQILYIADDDEYWKSPEHDPFSINEEYYKMYQSIRDNITIKHQERVQNNLIDLIKRNTQRNVKELNKAFLSLIKVDQDFKHVALSC